MVDWGYILQGFSLFIITIAAIAIILPLERMFPAVSKRPETRGRLRAISVIAILSAGVSFLFFAYGQNDVIRFVLGFQIMNVSRADVPDWVLFVGTFLFMDFLAYAIHWVSHKLTVLWRLHSVHHSDENVSAISALLQHPLGTLLSASVHLFFAVLLGLPLLVFVLYGVIAAVHAVFAHADFHLPGPVDRVLRWLMVTPDMHRTHHSVEMREGNSNFGMVLTIWDRLFGTYVDHPATGERDLVMGLPLAEKPARFSGTALFLHPFRSRK